MRFELGQRGGETVEIVDGRLWRGEAFDLGAVGGAVPEAGLPGADEGDGLGQFVIPRDVQVEDRAEGVFEAGPV